MSYSEQRESVSTSAPTFVGPYKLGKTLGQGVFAKVRLGEDDLGRRFAVKEFDKKAHRSEAHLKQVERELNALRILDHPNICQFSEVLETQTKVFLVMEYVSGGELYEYIHKTGKLVELDAARLFYQICSAVSHCHNNNIAHRDLKPENILLTEPDPALAAKYKPKDGLEGRQAKIVDLGLANFTGRDKYGEPMTKELKDAMFKTQCGSPHYAAPEVLLARDYKGRPVDIWSLGIILYAMLCARLPFHAATIPQLINKIVEGKYQIPDHVSAGAKNLIHNMLKIRPEERLDINKVMEHDWMKQHGPHLILPTHKEKVTPASGTQLSDDGKGVGSKDRSKREARCATCHKLLNMRVGKEGYVFLSTTGVGDSDKKDGESDKVVPGVSEADLCTCQAAPKKGESDKKEPSEYDPAQMEEQFFRAAETGDVHRLRVILKISSANPDLLKLDATATAKKWTALHYAAMMGHIQVVEALLTSMQKVDIDAVAEDGRTPLMLAAERGKLEVVRVFIECGADIHHTNKKGKTAIYMARERQFYDIAALLTEYSSEKRKRNETQDLKSQFRDHLYKAAEDGDEEKLKILLKQHFVLNTEGSAGAMAEPKSVHEPVPTSESDDGKDGKGGMMNLGVTSMDNFTALHHAARKGHVGVVNTLLTYVQGARKMLNIDAKTRSGWTPLMLAADRGRTGVVKLLLELGANPALTTNDDKTAEDLAKEQGHTECAKLLEKTKLIFLD